MSTLVGAPELVEIALAASSADHGCVVVVQATSKANVRWANNTVTTNGVAEDLRWFVVAFAGQSAGTVAASAAAATSRESIAAVVHAAEAAARTAAQAGPARDAAPLAPGDQDAEFDTRPASTDFTVYDRLLTGLAEAFEEARAGARILYGFARHEVTTTYLGTSTGVRRRWVQPTGTLEVNAKSADLARSSWAGHSTTDFTDVDVLATSRGLADRLAWSKRQIDLPAGRYTTVLPPTAVADFMLPLLWFNGLRAAAEGRSPFSKPGGGTKLGDRLVERPLSLYGDPAEPGLESVPFVATAASSEEISVFDNGLPIGRSEFIRHGSVSGLLSTRAAAAEFGETFTPPPDNLMLVGGDEARGLDDLITEVDRGLLVTSQWYLRPVDPMTLLLTGLTRDGVFLIEHGEVTAAVNNFRFNVSPFDVLRNGVDVGRTERCLSREWSDWFTRSAMPAIRVDGFNMSSVSKAL
jgi:predicted Zn-dependent protease